jgi:hypothetical protein
VALLVSLLRWLVFIQGCDVAVHFCSGHPLCPHRGHDFEGTGRPSFCCNPHLRILMCGRTTGLKLNLGGVSSSFVVVLVNFVLRGCQLCEKVGPVYRAGNGLILLVLVRSRSGHSVTFAYGLVTIVRCARMRDIRSNARLRSFCCLVNIAVRGWRQVDFAGPCPK